MHPGIRGLLAVCASMVFCFSSQAQTGFAGGEGDLQVQTNNAVARAGDGSLGDQVDLYSGSLTFRQTDASLPGNSALSVEITRRFDTARGRSTAGAAGAGFYDWFLDLPAIRLLHADAAGWPTNRCSTYWFPPTVYGPNALNTWDGQQYSPGMKLDLPGGSSALLEPQNGGFPRPSNFLWITTGNIGLSCTPAHNANGSSAGDGFIAWLPDGTSYQFTLFVSNTASPAKRPPDPDHGVPGVSLSRHTDILLVTQATDRFGNTVTYNYDSSARLTSIVGSDGRTLTLTWTTVDNFAVISSVTDGVRTWSYAYANQGLNKVTRPDSTSWQFSLQQLMALKPGDGSTNIAPGGTATGTIISPYGLTGTFNLNGSIAQPYGGYPDSMGDPSFYAGSLVSKQLSGPGIPQQTWAYSYSDTVGWNYSAGTGPQTKQVSVTDPAGIVTRYTYNINYDWREGDLDMVEVLPYAGAASIQTMTNTYVSTPILGFRPGYTSNPYSTAQAKQKTATTISVNGDSYTMQFSNFDAYKQPAQITESNSFSGVTRTTTMAIQNNSAGSPWLLGVTTGTVVNGVQVSQATLNSQFQPQDQYAFGLRKSTTNYSANGLPQTQLDGLNHSTGLSNYYRGQAQTVTRPDGVNVYKTVNPTGTIASVTDALGYTTTMGYDSLNRPTSIQFPTGDTVAWANITTSYAILTAAELGVPVGSFRARMIQGRLQTSTYYDAELRPVLVESKDTTNGIAKYVRTTYDSAGRATFKSYPWATPDAPSGITSIYDALGRLIQTTATGGVTLKTITYLNGNRMQVTDASGNVTTTSFQAFGAPSYSRPLTVIAPAGQTTTIARDLFGNLISVIQGGVTRSWVYDGNYRLCKKVEPETGQSVYQYNADDKILWSVHGYPGTPTSCDNSAEPSNSIHYSYDVLDRRTLIHYTDGTSDENTAYDLDGHLLSTSNSTAAWSYTYNKRGFTETEQASIDGHVYTLDPAYDAQGNLATEIFPDGLNVNYAPDAFGRPTQMNATCCGNGTPIGLFVSGIQYFPNDIPSGYGLGNGLSVSTTLNARQAPAMMQVLQGSTSLQSVSYTYNNDLDITSISDNVDGSDSATLGYDGLHRLTSASGIWGGYIYGYDTGNNITSRIGGAGTLTYNYLDGTNRLNSISGITRNYAYDTRGRVTSDALRTYTWNDADEITAVPNAATYGYDANGKRIRTTKADGTIEYALYDSGGRLVYVDHPASGQHSVYLELAGKPLAEVTNGNPTYLHPDLLGSPKMATNSSQQLLWREHFDPYGSKLNGVAEKIGYTGHAYDMETGLTYAQARFYDPAVGRFLSNDPIGFTNNPFSFNRYAYANNNPYIYTDPTGMAAGNASGAADVDGLPPTLAVRALAGLEQAVQVLAGAGEFAFTSAAAFVAQSFIVIGAAIAPGNGFENYDGSDTLYAGMPTVPKPVASDSSPVAPADTPKKPDATTGTGNSVRENNTKGKKAEDEVASDLESAGRRTERQVRKQTPFGPRVIDIEVSDKDGNVLGGVEVKSGNSRYRQDQRSKDEWLRQNGYTVDVVRKP